MSAYDEGVKRVAGAVESAVGVAVSGTSDDWTARLSAGLRAGLDLLAAEPELARLLLVEALQVAGEARLAHERSVARLAAALRSPDERSDGRSISDEMLSLQAHGLISYLSGCVLADETEQLPEIHEPLLRYLLAFR